MSNNSISLLNYIKQNNIWYNLNNNNNIYINYFEDINFRYFKMTFSENNLYDIKIIYNNKEYTILDY